MLVVARGHAVGHAHDPGQDPEAEEPQPARRTGGRAFVGDRHHNHRNDERERGYGHHDKHEQSCVERKKPK